MGVYAQSSTTSLQVNDTRDINEPPSYFKNELRADLKQLATTGISTAYGFSTTLSISPWFDDSAGSIHQLNFNNNGMYYRNSKSLTLWNSWKKLLIGSAEGDLEINSLSVNNGITMGSSQDNTNSSLFILGPNSPTMEAGKRDIIFDFKNAGQSGIRAFRGDEWGTYLQLMTSQPGDATGTPRVRMHIDQYGNVGIGTANTQDYKLAVNGVIRAKEIKVDSEWADFVFKKDYKLPTLEEVETHINEKGTLPGVPSEADVKANGVNLAETDALLLQKIEELTLYVIKQQKEIDSLKEQIRK